MTSDRVLAGRYRLVRPIARGGMAEVWEGRDEVLTRPVAVKVLHAHLARDPDFAERFRREAVAAARLAHPNIVATYDAGTDGDTAFIVMELVNGHTVRQALENGPLPVRSAVAVAVDVADALDCAHRNGLVHRDVKPANILLASSPGGNALRVKVADFGIAKLEAEAGGELTQPGAVIGTAKYLSPEQVKGQTPDARSDVYALGVVLYELLCGRPPFAAETELATALQHVNGSPVPPRRLVAGIPKPVEAVVLRAMARNPADRFQSAAELRDALADVDIGDDDAEPAFVRRPGDDTPPDGVAPVARRPRRSWAPLVSFSVVAVAAVVTAAVLLRPGDEPTAPEAAEPGATAQPVSIASAVSFDPEADGNENSDLAPRVLDGDRRTDWHSSTYQGPSFAGLKSGVGLVFRVSPPRRLAELKAYSTVRGWSASVYVAASPGRQLADWGEPVATRAEIAGDTTFDLRGRQGGAVLLWITDPGPQHRAEITEVTLSGS